MPQPRITLLVYPFVSGSVDTDPTVSQYLRALGNAVPNARSTLQATVSASPDDQNRVILDTTQVVTSGGTFETLVRTTLGLTATQVAVIRAAALLLPI